MTVAVREYPKGVVGAQMLIHDPFLSTDLTGLNFQPSEDEATGWVERLNLHWAELSKILHAKRAQFGPLEESYCSVEFRRHSLGERLTQRIGVGFAAGSLPAVIVGGSYPVLTASVFVMGFALSQFLVGGTTQAKNGPFDSLLRKLARAQPLIQRRATGL